MMIAGRITVTAERPKARKSDTDESRTAAEAAHLEEFTAEVIASARPLAAQQRPRTGVVLVEVEQKGQPLRAFEVSFGTVPPTLTELTEARWREAGGEPPEQDGLERVEVERPVVEESAVTRVLSPEPSASPDDATDAEEVPDDDDAE